MQVPVPGSAGSMMLHVVPAAVHPRQSGVPDPMQPPAWFSWQHGLPRPPQVAQAPLAQAPSCVPLPLTQACPLLTHLPSMQHPPPSQAKAGQQGCPEAPQPGPKSDPPVPAPPVPAPELAPGPEALLPAPTPVLAEPAVATVALPPHAA
jgi:hypothetical protein